MPDVNPTPPEYPGVMAYLSVRDATAALDFYTRAFGATERGRMPMPDGRIGHAEMELAGGVIMLADEMPEAGTQSPAALGATTFSLMFYVPDVDAAYERAVAAGATGVMAPADQFYGDRSCSLRDPFGHMWTIQTHIRDVSMEEMTEAMKG